MKKKRLQAENKKRIKVQSIASRKCLWAFRMFIIAVFMSLFFGFLSQTLLSKMGALIAIIGIIFFIFVSVFFDMIGIAVASADIETFRSWAKEKKIGADIGIKLCENSEKVCSFCADVVIPAWPISRRELFILGVKSFRRKRNIYTGRAGGSIVTVTPTFPYD